MRGFGWLLVLWGVLYRVELFSWEWNVGFFFFVAFSFMEVIFLFFCVCLVMVERGLEEG